MLKRERQGKLKLKLEGEKKRAEMEKEIIKSKSMVTGYKMNLRRERSKFYKMKSELTKANSSKRKTEDGSESDFENGKIERLEREINFLNRKIKNISKKN